MVTIYQSRRRHVPTDLNFTSITVKIFNVTVYLFFPLPLLSFLLLLICKLSCSVQSIRNRGRYTGVEISYTFPLQDQRDEIKNMFPAEGWEEMVIGVLFLLL